MDATRALLDSLMGPNRNAALEDQARDDGWKDDNVCKRFLVLGICPNNVNDNWFKNTKVDTTMQMSHCNKLHSEALKASFERHEEHDQYEPIYAAEFKIYLENVVAEVNLWIKRDKLTCKPVRPAKLPPEIVQQIEDKNTSAEELTAEAEEKANHGEFSASKACLEQANKLKEDADTLKEKHMVTLPAEAICDVCGKKYNHDGIDFQVHCESRHHIGYQKIRDALAQLEEKEKRYRYVRGTTGKDFERDKPRGTRESPRNGSDRNFDQDGRKDADRGRERDHHRNRARKYDPSNRRDVMVVRDARDEMVVRDARDEGGLQGKPLDARGGAVSAFRDIHDTAKEYRSAAVQEHRRRSRSRSRRSRTVRLYVENLPGDFDATELELIGAAYGTVLCHRIWQEGKTNAGYIEYESGGEANKALTDLHGRRIDGWDMKLNAFIK